MYMLIIILILIVIFSLGGGRGMARRAPSGCRCGRAATACAFGHLLGVSACAVVHRVENDTGLVALRGFRGL